MPDMGLTDKVYKIPFVLQSKLPFRIFSDRFYLSCTFRGLMKKKLDWNNPKTFNEKLQILKLKETSDDFTSWADKKTAKEKAEKMIGRQMIIPTLGFFQSLEEFENRRQELSEPYILKTTHNSGGVWLIGQDHPYTSAMKHEIQKNLQENYYNQWREGPYKNIRPALIAEKYMGSNLNDYKLFCFHGEPKVILVCSDRETSLREDFFDISWNHLDLSRAKHPNAQTPPQKPDGLDRMLAAARTLSSGYDFVRVDLFEIDGQIYFGEMTFIPACGFEGFSPQIWDDRMGSWI